MIILICKLYQRNIVIDIQWEIADGSVLSPSRHALLYVSIWCYKALRAATPATTNTSRRYFHPRNVRGCLKHNSFTCWAIYDNCPHRKFQPVNYRSKLLVSTNSYICIQSLGVKGGFEIPRTSRRVTNCEIKWGKWGGINDTLWLPSD